MWLYLHEPSRAVQMDNTVSLFAASETDEVEPIYRFGNFKILRRISEPSRILSAIFKVNLVAGLAFVAYCALMLEKGRDLGPNIFAVIAAIFALPLFYFVFVWYRHLPRRVKITAQGIYIACDFSDAFYSEQLIPWSLVRSVEIKNMRNFYPEAEPHLVIKLGGARALETHYIALDQVYTDNSEISLLHDLDTWAPHLRFALPGAIGDNTRPGLRSDGRDNAFGGHTELWLHEFATAGGRKNSQVLKAGDSLKGGAYVVQGLLSGGGQGNTYVADVADLAESIDNKCVLKCVLKYVLKCVLKEYILPIYRGAGVTEALADKLHYEAGILKKLHHPNIVALHDVFVEDFRGYLVLEYAQGVTLRQLLADLGPLPQQDILEIARILSSVLAYLHGQYPPVLHRDLAPDNIMVDETDYAASLKVVDFNVAQVLEAGRGGTIVGKQAYLAPEQFRGHPLPASDIYSLGATLFFLATGCDPQPLGLSDDSLQQLPMPLQEIVAACTAFKAEDRPGAIALGEILAANSL